MNKRTRILAGSLLALLIIVAALALFIRYEIRRSFPQTTGILKVQGLQDTVVVIRDAYGVPHIDAKNDHDLLMAFGYVQAQDRLWQMDMSRRAAMGRLSELFGPATVAFDRMFRTAGLTRAVDAEDRALSPDLRNRLQWFADGVNAFIGSAGGHLPVEFDLLRYSPEPWQTKHSLLVGKLLAWELNLSWWTDLTYGGLVSRLGMAKTISISPGYDNQVAPEVPASVWKSYAENTRSYLETAEQFAAVSSSADLRGGSNAWAVAPRRSSNGSAILANDTHLRLELPSRWYEAALKSRFTNVAGMSIAGIPAIIAGRNAHIAWGVTNVMADEADFYIEQIDSTDSTRYFFDGQSYPLTVVSEEIGVRGHDPVPVRIRITRHGPIVTDFTTSLQSARPPYVASMQWTGAEPDNSLGAFVVLDSAKSWSEFTEGLRLFSCPSQNFVYADVDGNIGYWCAGRIPIRAHGHGMFPSPGWERDAEWKGFVPFRELPHMYDPPSGFIASANNKLTDDSYPYPISDLWEPPARIQRLREVLGADSVHFSPDDFQRLQTDAMSMWAKEMLPYIMNAVRDSVLGVPDESRFLEYFKNWNFTFATDDIATSVYEEFIVRLLRNTFADEMGDDLFHDWVLLANVPIRVITSLMHDDPEQWFDNISTPEVETRDMIIRRSLREAYQALESRFGSDMKHWRWGDVHTVTLRHPFGLQKPLDRIFNIGPFPVAGASTALISGEYDFNAPFEVTVAPSYRQIFSLSTGETRSIIPGGESGQVYEPHYGDQVSMWLAGETRVQRWDRPPDRGETLRLVP
ncbi:MAG TPA: penicillin acylase family protein [Bacteroidota bacterium]|nr:penicillin acylase family protein [Bacteroidota bacterium]